MPFGGHTIPSSTVGAKEESWNAQKKEIKKKTSDKMKRSTEMRRAD
jgi:hypothetical protein